MCLFTRARTVAIVFARSAGSEAMYCAGVLTFDAGFMNSSSSRPKCITEHLKSSQCQCREHRLCLGGCPTFRLLVRGSWGASALLPNSDPQIISNWFRGADLNWRPSALESRPGCG